jgi:tetratricopeptide (TPR) repeat protein
VGSAVLIALASQWEDLRHALTTNDAYVQGRWMALATVLCVLGAAAARYATDGWFSRVRLPRTVARRGLAVVVVIGLIVLAFSHPIDRIKDFSNSSDIAGASAATGGGHVFSTSGTGRSQFWGQAIDAFESEPVIGIGAGNYELWWNQHHTIDVITIDAHSLYLQTLAELGILGILLLLGFLGASLYAGWRAVARRPDVGPGGEVMAAALAVFLAGLTSAAFDWTWQLPAAFASVIMTAALLTGPASQPVAVVAEPGSTKWMPKWRARGSQYGLAVATLVVAWVAIWVAGDQLVASVQLDSSRSALANGDFESAAQSARNASAIQPWSSEAQLQLALAEKANGDIAAATAAGQEAIDKASHDWRTWLVAAEVAAAAGNRQAATVALAFANRLSPKPLPVKLAPQR